MVEVIGALHVTLIGRAERKRDLPIGRSVDLLAVERLQIGYRFCQSGLELIDGRLVIFVAGRLDAREARGAVLSVIRRHLNLTSEIEHVREQTRMKKHCGVDFFGGRISRGFVENGRQRIETGFENSGGKLETLKTAWNVSLDLMN